MELWIFLGFEHVSFLLSTPSFLCLLLLLLTMIRGEGGAGTRLTSLLRSGLRPRGPPHHLGDLLHRPLRHRLGPRELGRLDARGAGVGARF